MACASQRPTRNRSHADRVSDVARVLLEFLGDDGPRRVCVLTGAGMSAESGVPTFRGGGDSLWSRFDPMELATAAAWRRDPALVWAWYRWRMQLVREAAPNAGHVALAQLQQRGVALGIVTQNVDDLHERAGAEVAAHVHGELFALRCFACARPHAEPLPDYVAGAERMPPPHCMHCGGDVRPGVVWFGESLPDAPWQRAQAAAIAADLVLVVGTSGLVMPAAGLPALARRHGAVVVEINSEPTPLSPEVDHVWRTTAAQALPQLLAVWS